MKLDTHLKSRHEGIVTPMVSARFGVSGHGLCVYLLRRKAMPNRRDDVPSTIAKSDKRAQEIYSKTHDSAVQTYGEGERAHRVAYASLKHEYRKSGDHWVPKGHRGPSDAQAAGGRDTGQHTAGGYDVGPQATLKELRQEASELGIAGRSKMGKDELRRAIGQKAGR